MAAMIAFLSVDCCALAPLQDTGVYADVLSIDMSLLWHAHFLTPLSILFLNAISSSAFESLPDHPTGLSFGRMSVSVM
jgi:hypothetical protein